MLWRVSVGFAVTVSSLAFAGGSTGARADDAYICGPNTIVYVKLEDLEAKKRSDPCIAAYYGLKVEQPGVTATTAEVIAPLSPAAPPVRNIAAELKPLVVSELPSRVTPKLERQAALAPAVTAPGTNYRDVRVLNATSSADAWFHHEK
jgi:hypothetical protein